MTDDCVPVCIFYYGEYEGRSSLWWAVSLGVVARLFEEDPWVWTSRVEGGKEERGYNVAGSVVWGVVLH